MAYYFECPRCLRTFDHDQTLSLSWADVDCRDCGVEGCLDCLPDGLCDACQDDEERFRQEEE